MYLSNNSSTQVDRQQGWCKRNYHADGKRKFGKLVNGLCAECCPAKDWKQTLPRSKPEVTSETNQVHQIIQIIKQINETPDLGKVLMRQGFNKIDELGTGFQLLGYATDEEYLAAEFRRTPNYLRQQRTCGRLEKIIQVPIGTYSFDDLYPLFQFRVVIRGKSKPRFNAKGIELIEETWEKALLIAEGKSPNREHIILAVEQMTKLGKAKPVRIRRGSKWEDKYKALLGAYALLEKENQQKQKELDRLTKEPKCKRKPFAKNKE